MFLWAVAVKVDDGRVKILNFMRDFETGCVVVVVASVVVLVVVGDVDFIISVVAMDFALDKVDSVAG